MGHLAKKLFAAGSLALAAAAAAGGCADNESQLFIQGVLVPQPSPDCSVTADPGAAMRLGGLLDVAFTNTYQGALLVGNQLTERGSREEIKTETSRVVIRGAEVQILTTQQQLITEFTVPATGFVDQGIGADASYGAATVTMIDPATGNALAGQLAGGGTTTVVVEVRVFGESLGGSEITSAPLSYPIQVCNGCSLSCPTEDPGVDPPCRPGNDDTIDCGACTGFQICRDAIAAAQRI